MNLPNRLTMLRVLMIPLCLLFIMVSWYLPAAIVFALAALTDFLDGYLARRDKLVTKEAGSFRNDFLSVPRVAITKGRHQFSTFQVKVHREQLEKFEVIVLEGCRIADKYVSSRVSNHCPVGHVIFDRSIVPANILCLEPWIETTGQRILRFDDGDEIIQPVERVR